MAFYNDFKQLSKAIMKHTEETMKNQVAPVVKEAVSDEVESTVYNRYKTSQSDGQPYVYNRRGTSEGSGGIGDTTAMETRGEVFTNGYSMTIVNRAKGQDETSRYIADLVEFGHGGVGGGYNYTSNRDTSSPSYLEARPFQANAANKLESSKEHIDVFINGMANKGIKITKL